MKVRLFLHIFLVLLGVAPFLLAEPWADTTPKSASVSCPRLYAQFSAHLFPLSTQDQFLDRVLYPVVGRRAFSTGTELRMCTIDAKNCLIFPSQGKDYRVEWVKADTDIPWVESTARTRTLKIPEHIDLTSQPDRGRSYVQQWLVGSDLHPFVTTPEVILERRALREAPIFLKQSQKDAIEALKEADLAGQRKILLVSPTAWGKTEVLKALLSQRLSSAGSNLTVLIADQTGLSEQLLQELKALQKKIPMKIVYWGGGEKSSSPTELLELASSSNAPVVLVSTIQSLKASMKKAGWDQSIEALRPRLSTLIYDEAHHSGAPEAKILIEGLIDHPDSRATLIGATATPVHRNLGVQQFFDDQAYWAYLDGKKSFRPVDDVVEQLSRAIAQGELTPFESTYFVTPGSLGLAADASLFIPGANGRYILDPRHYDSLFKRLQPLFKKHERGFLTVSTTDEADDLANYLNQTTPGRKFAVLHSKLTPTQQAEVKRLYKEGKIDFLITAKFLDEGVRFPGMSLYVDLNRNLGSRQFLQRIGRVLALEQGKDRVDVVSLMELDASRIQEHIALIDRILEGKLSLPQGPASTASTQSVRSLTGDYQLAPELFDLSRDEMRNELRKLRDQLVAFWSKGATESVAAARTGSQILEYGSIPTRSGNYPLYLKLTFYREDEGLQRILKTDPKLWKEFLTWKATLKTHATGEARGP